MLHDVGRAPARGKLAAGCTQMGLASGVGRTRLVPEQEEVAAAFTTRFAVRLQLRASDARLTTVRWLAMPQRTGGGRRDRKPTRPEPAWGSTLLDSVCIKEAHLLAFPSHPRSVSLGNCVGSKRKRKGMER